MSRPAPTRLATLLFAAALAPAAAAQLPDAAAFRWRTTATNGSGLVQGDATTLTWGIVADGVTIGAAFPERGEQTTGSGLIEFLDANVGDAAVNGSTSVVRNKDWFRHFESYHERYDALSGLSYEYVDYDDGARLRTAAGELGVRPDVRIGGHFIDGGSGVLAYNAFPGDGDMVIDTADAGFYGRAANDYVGLRNVLAHEHGHGIGQPHVVSNTSRYLMEPNVDVSFDGPQLVDILQTQRGYGDVLEKFGGNDLAATASSLGAVLSGDVVAVGMDAALGPDQSVLPEMVDFFTVDGLSDTDFWSFTVDAPGFAELLLEPLGPLVNLGPQGGSQAAFDFAAQSDLALALFASDGTTLLGQSNFGGLGEAEFLGASLDPGLYFARVNAGGPDAAQFYGLSVGFTAEVPEPGTWALILAAAVGCMLSRRRRTRAVTRAA